jgi:hypothetical protein
VSFYQNARKRGGKKDRKKINQLRHAKFRAATRFGIELTVAVRKHILDQIRNNRSVHLEKTSNRVTLHLVQLPNGELARVAYDKNRGSIVTVMLPRKRDYLLFKTVA